MAEYVGEDEVLEALYRVKRRLAAASANGRGAKCWEFDEWPRCTCGHVYAVTVDKMPRTLEARELAITNPRATDGLYERVLGVIADVHGLGLDPFPRELHQLVSDETSRRAVVARDRYGYKGYQEARLGVARDLIADTIEAVEAGHRKAAAMVAGE